MLAGPHRLRSSRDFSETVRGGRRAGSASLVVHLLLADAVRDPVRVGLVVGRTVGPAVTRNRVKRRLRHVIGPRLAELPGGATLVVRARPGAADASTAALASDLDRALLRVQRSAAGPAGRVAAARKQDQRGRRSGPDSGLGASGAKS